MDNCEYTLFDIRTSDYGRIGHAICRALFGYLPVFFKYMKKGKTSIFFRNNKSLLLRAAVIGIPSVIFTAFNVAANVLAIPERREANLSELNKPLFAGAEDATKNIKIASQFDPVNLK
jgi:hypothetical protein